MACLFSVCFQSFAAFLQVQLGDVENGLECQGRFHVDRRYFCEWTEALLASLLASATTTS